VPDGGRFMAFPPMVQRESMAVPMAQDVRLYVEHLGGRLPLMARARLMGGSRRMGFVHGFYEFLSSASVPSPSLGQKRNWYMSTRLPTADNSQPLVSPYLTFSYLYLT
jgi:hypothetical protein